ncbi:MAG: DnaA/Hda family protein [candidate division WOR-3 bacterium]
MELILPVIEPLLRFSDGWEVLGNKILIRVKNGILAELIGERFMDVFKELESKGYLVELLYPGKEKRVFRETFDNFYYDKENEFAVIALKSLITNPSNYRIAIIFGDAGLGKTHLLKAMANKCLEIGKKPIYVQSQRILDEILSSYRNKKKPNFEFLKGADIILIDDLHLLKGKTFVLEFLARLVDKVESSGKTLVMSSQGSLFQFNDTPSFKTRLMSSLRLTLNPPTKRVRESIFKEACLRFGISPGYKAVDFVSNNINNPRGIIGAATRIKAYYDVYGIYPEGEELRRILGDLVEGGKLDVFKVFGRGKPGKYFIAYYLKKTGVSINEICEILDCSRATVYNYIKKAEEIMDKNPKWKEKVESLLNPIRSQP